MKYSFTKKITSILLAVALILGTISPLGASAIDISGGDFNPSANEMTVNFTLQLDQWVDINIYVENQLFGKILDHIWISGTDGEIQPRDPCADMRSSLENMPTQISPSDTPPSPSAGQNSENTESLLPVVTAEIAALVTPTEFVSAADELPLPSMHPALDNIGTDEPGTRTTEMIQKFDVSITPKRKPTFLSSTELVQETRAGVDSSVTLTENAPGDYTLVWNGRVNGHPVIGGDRTKDIVEVRFEIQPLGTPELDEPCTTDADGNTVHGKDYSWPSQFTAETQLLIDYRTTTENGDPLVLMVRGSLTDQYVQEMSEAFRNGALCEYITQNPNAAGIILNTNSADPVNMVDGNYHSSHVDLQLGGNIPLSFLRLYNSRYVGGSLGKGFTHSYEYSLVDDDGIIRITMPYGEQLNFLWLKNGDYHSLQDSGFTLENNSSGYLLSHEGGATFHFSTQGQLETVKNPSGVIVAALSYTGNLLTGISGIAGDFTIAWADGYIQSVTDNMGRSTKYTQMGGLLTEIENPDGDTMHYEYDENNFASSVTDYDGVCYLENTYDTLGRVTHQSYVLADVTTEYRITYDDTAHTSMVTEPSGRSTTYHFDKYRNIQRITDDDGESSNTYQNFKADSLQDNQNNKTTYAYSADGLVEKITRPDGSELKYTYTADCQVKSIEYPNGGIEKFEYDGNHNLLKFTDQNGGVVEYKYNTFGLPIEEIDQLGNKTLSEYDTEGRLLKVIDAEGGTIEYSYDAAGRMSSIKDPLGGVTSYIFSPGGKLTSAEDPLGNTTTYTYNGSGLTTSTTDALGNTAHIEYGANGQPRSTTDALGNTTRYYHNSEGLIEREENSLRGITEYTYNDKGLVTEVKDADGVVTKYEYDSLDRQEKAADGNGNGTVITFDSMGRTKTETNPLGGVTEYEYDQMGQLVKTKDALNNITSYTYDKNGNQLTVTDAENVETASAYDAANRQISTTDGMGKTTTYTYDKVGRLLTTTDPLGNVTQQEYDKAGNCTKVIDPRGNAVTYTFDILGHQTMQNNPDGTSTRKVYNELSQVIEEYDELGSKTSYTYDARGSQLSSTNAKGYTTTFSYDALGRQSGVTYPDGGNIQYVYTPGGRTKAEYDQNGNATIHEYNSLGQESSVSDGSGIVTSFVYDDAGNVQELYQDGHLIEKNTYDLSGQLLSVEDGNGRITKYQYNGVGQQISIIDRNGGVTKYTLDKNYRIIVETDPMGGEKKASYDNAGRVIERVDAEGKPTSYTMDSNGNVLTETNSMGGTTNYTYDSMNRQLTMIDPRGGRTKYEYTTDGQISITTNPLGQTTKNTYNELGLLVEQRDPGNEKTLFEYDAMGRPTKTTNQLNHSATTTYDKVGNIIATTDENKHNTTYTFDGANRALTQTDPEGGVCEYTYNYLGKVSSTTTWGGSDVKSTTRYTWDSAGFLLSEVSPLGYVVALENDAEGNVLSQTDRDGKITSYEYDALNRPVKRTDTDGTVEFSCDGMGNLLSATDATGTVSFSYDDLYRVTTVNDGTVSSQEQITTYTYDEMGNRLSIAYPDGKSVDTTYDLAGRVSALTDYDGTGIVYLRDSSGRVTKESHSDGSTTEYAYNAAGLLTQQKEVDKSNHTRREILYGYDDAGNLRSEQQSGVDIQSKDENVRYYYDNADRLTQTTTEGVTVSSTYDKAGNLLSDGKNAYTYDLQNRLRTQAGADGTTNYEYDKSGNLTKKIAPTGVSTYEYNAQNRMVKGTNERGETSEYTYNALGVRVRNVQNRGNANTGYQNVLLNNGSQFIKDYMPTLSDGRNTWQRVWETEVGTTVQSERETVDKTYVVDYLSTANRDIMVYEKGSFVQRNVYDVNGRRMSTELSYAEGTQRGEPGENIASDTAVNSISKVWYRTSHLGSTLYAVDKYGDVLTHTVYDPWGNPITEAKTDLNLSGLDNRNNYTGYTWDEVLGLYFAQARFYDPLIHRFTQEDPARDGTNWYVYCANNPRNVVDVTGEFGTPIQWACAVIGGIAGWYFGDYVARQFGHTEGCVYWAIRAGVVIGGAVIGWFAGTAVIKIATAYLKANPSVLAKIPTAVRWFLGLSGASQVAAQGALQIAQQSQGFSNFDQLKRALGAAGNGYQWHHIVEQCQQAKSGFDAFIINNTANIIKISNEVHSKISGYYNTKSFDFTGGLKVRDWLAGQSFQTQYEFGLSVLRKFGVIK